MNPSNFEELTKALANSTSRRHALRVILTTSIGGLLGLTSIGTAFGRHRHPSKITAPSGPKSNSNCAKFCAAVFGANTSAAGQCTSDAAHGRGLCHDCGTKPPSSICCHRVNGYCNGTAGACCSAGCPGCPTGQTCTDTGCCATVGGNCNGDNDCCSGLCLSNGTCARSCGLNLCGDVPFCTCAATQPPICGTGGHDPGSCSTDLDCPQGQACNTFAGLGECFFVC